MGLVHAFKFLQILKKVKGLVHAFKFSQIFKNVKGIFLKSVQNLLKWKETVKFLEFLTLSFIYKNI